MRHVTIATMALAAMTAVAFADPLKLADDQMDGVSAGAKSGFQSVQSISVIATGSSNGGLIIDQSTGSRGKTMIRLLDAKGKLILKRVVKGDAKVVVRKLAGDKAKVLIKEVIGGKARVIFGKVLDNNPAQVIVKKVGGGKSKTVVSNKVRHVSSTSITSQSVRAFSSINIK